MSETASEIAVLRAALAAAEARASAAEDALVAAKGELTQVQVIVLASEDMIRHLRLQIAKLRREQYGQSASYNDLYRHDHKPAPVRSALCWAHARRKVFELADIKATARKGKKVPELLPWNWKRCLIAKAA